MRILIYNWKDIKHPAAGGAEVFTHEVAKRWVQWGHEVTLFCARPDGHAERDVIDGVKVVRRGGRFTVYREAPRFWRTEARGNFDHVVDVINTRPFFAIKFAAPAQVTPVIFQTAGEAWASEFPFPISSIGSRVLEPRWLSRYRHVPVVTISKSSRDSLRSHGVSDTTIIPMGATHHASTPKTGLSNQPVLLFIGRLTHTKGALDAVKAFHSIAREFPTARLIIAGHGYLAREMERLKDPRIEFRGRVSDAEKWSLMREADLVLMPSVREGWGIVATEANAVGTPVVGYRVKGLVDAIDHDVSGVLVEPHPDALARATIELLRSPRRLLALSHSAFDHASGSTWERTAAGCLEVVTREPSRSGAP